MTSRRYLPGGNNNASASSSASEEAIECAVEQIPQIRWVKYTASRGFLPPAFSQSL
jgi:hypothetical protein